MFNPGSTYRIQFNKDFTFTYFEQIIPYLHALGIKTIYASPIFESAPGSTHGYDGTDPLTINPEIGTEEQLINISSQLKNLDMCWIQDIVPNHMAFHSNNKWLMNVLEEGRSSAYASYFDIFWDSEIYGGRIMAPFLNGSLKEATIKGELKMAYENGHFLFTYFDNKFPASKRSVEMITSLCTDPEACVKLVNESTWLLEHIIDEQFYILCDWQETDNNINYRRFFTVNGLICLNMQDKNVFSVFHQYIHKLVKEDIFQGLRVDHIDGLYDPEQYLQWLRELVGPQMYIIVEKILQQDEYLPLEWPVQGSTGYDFLGMVNNLLTQSGNEKKFTKFYENFIDADTSIDEQFHQKKSLILYNHMGGELENLYRLFKESFPSEVVSVEKEYVKAAIGSLLIQCPVYRYYGNSFPLKDDEAKALEKLFQQIYDTIDSSSFEQQNYSIEKPELKTKFHSAVNILEKIFLHSKEENTEKLAHFYKRCMQFSGPLMAKGIEDTLMYTYNRFIGHNDVGDSPAAFGSSPEMFHEQMIIRQKKWPLAANTISTHDTKRGEDVRARLNIITALEDWPDKMEEWQSMNADLKLNNMPDPNDEYFIYQTLIGIYDPLNEKDLEERLRAYLQKALREAKVHSDWAKPNELYEQSSIRFALALLDKGRPFWQSFENLLHQITDAGIINSLSQLILKCTCPGIPDIYQGTELWDYSLVDPDNRSPVNYETRQWFFQPQKGQASLTLKELWNNREDGQIKLKLTQLLLHLREQNKNLFAAGSYIPLTIKGRYCEHIFAFARRHQRTWYITVIPLHLITLQENPNAEILQIDWDDTAIMLPEELPATWENVLTNISGMHQNALSVKEIFAEFPLALLKLEHKTKERAAGILLHITSLPSSFGIGDFGPAALSFADFLSRSNQKYWQILPLNPISAQSNYSPYSSTSCMAGNILLISPELLEEEGLLDAAILEKYKVSQTDKVNFESAHRNKILMLEEAYRRFSKRNIASEQQQFKEFCIRESAWLDDYALYVILKKTHNNTSWYEWPNLYKNRDPKLLEQFKHAHQEEICEVMWLQYMFMKQWKDLKQYCHGLGIKLFGDLPFYLSYDSADVWAHSDIFSLDENKKMTGIGGVPPDYFSENGQLWNMPTFRWEVLKNRKYDWWISRLKKNMELFDLLRLDHFRAFESFWEVPAGELTAKKGTWKPGPRKEFFEAVEKALGKLPFVAEDLGDDMEKVYAFRDELDLPGMKLLQFAFGENIADAVDIPHNFSTTNCIVYTGTHDNNTTLGWYNEELKEADKQRLEAYVGTEVNKKNAHIILSKMAYASVANIAILPLQDILGLNKESRMNFPGSDKNNWMWSVSTEKLNEEVERLLRSWTKLYGRI
jgi:malto-oligosyltrehalose synthase/4-alpha-glucanotransferase